MSSLVSQTLNSMVTVAAAALCIQIGSAAAASPRADFQQQVGRVLAGTPAHRPLASPAKAAPDRLARDADTQAFVRRLLSGVSLSHPATADSGAHRPPSALEIARGAGAAEDEQTSVQQLLLGVHTPMRGVL